jgi:hypothetical protein
VDGTCIGRSEMYTKFWLESLNERDHLTDLGIHGRIILKFILMKASKGTEWIPLAQDRDQWSGSCKQGREHLGSMKSRKFD